MPQSGLQGRAFVNYHKSVVSDNRPTIKAMRTFCRASSFSRFSISSPALGSEYVHERDYEATKTIWARTLGKNGRMDIVEDEEQMQKIEWAMCGRRSRTRVMFIPSTAQH